MRRIIVLFTAFVLFGCAHNSEKVYDSKILHAQVDYFIKAPLTSLRILTGNKANVSIYKGMLSYYMLATHENKSTKDVKIRMECAYYARREPVGKKYIYSISLSPKTKKKIFKRLFYIEQRLNWRCKIR